MKFAHVRKANISHLRSKYFAAKRFHLPEWANFVGAPALSQVPQGGSFSLWRGTGELDLCRRGDRERFSKAIKSSRFYLNLSEGSRTPISHDKEKPPHKVELFFMARHGGARSLSPRRQGKVLQSYQELALLLEPFRGFSHPHITR